MDENEIGTVVVDCAVKLHKSLGPVLLETVPLSPFISVPLCLREIPPSPCQTIKSIKTSCGSTPAGRHRRPFLFGLREWDWDRQPTDCVVWSRWRISRSNRSAGLECQSRSSNYSVAKIPASQQSAIWKRRCTGKLHNGFSRRHEDTEGSRWMRMR